MIWLYLQNMKKNQSNKNIKPGYRYRIWHKKKAAMLKEKEKQLKELNYSIKKELDGIHGF